MPEHLEQSDQDLLNRWSQDRDADAFAELSRRYVNLVHGTAMRQMRGRSDLAEDVTQAVFIVLARKAGSIRHGASLAGWLHQTTCYACANARRSEIRRAKHEKIASQNRPEPAMPMTDQNPDFPTQETLALLDQAIAALGSTDRNAIVARYLHGQSIEQVAQTIASTTPATQKRLERAIAKMRSFFGRKNLSISGIALLAALESTTSHAAPAHLAGVSASTATATIASSSALSFSLAQGTLAMMQFARVKFVAMITLSFVLLSGTSTWIARSVLAEESKPSFAATLDNGVGVEILGLAAHPSEGTTWWAADGTALDVAPVHMRDIRVAPVPGKILREIAVRLHLQITSGDSNVGSEASVRTELVDGEKISTNYSVAQALTGQFKPIIDTFVGVAPIEDKPLNIRLRFAAGRWQTRAQNGTTGALASVQENGNAISFTQPMGSPNGVAISVVHTYTDLDFRVLARMKDGSSAPMIASNQMLMHAKGAEIAVGTWMINRPLKQIEQFELQTRAYDQSVMFSNIAVHAGQKTDFKSSVKGKSGRDEGL